MRRLTAKIGTTLFVALLAGVALGASGADAAPDGPAWHLEVNPYPTRFQPGPITAAQGGPGVQVFATNLGGTATEGEITVSVEVTGGASISSSREVGSSLPGKLTGDSTMTCSQGTTTVTCSASTPPVGPGTRVEVLIPLDLSAAAVAGGEIVTEATVMGGGAATATTTLDTPVSAEAADFGYLDGSAGANVLIVDGDGSATTLAGAHPYAMSINFGFPGFEVGGDLFSAGGGVRDVSAALPKGLVVDPLATPRCREAELESQSSCPPGSQIGLVRVDLSIRAAPGARFSPLYNMVPSPGVPGEFGLEVGGLEGVYVHIQGHLSSDGRYELSASTRDITAKAAILGVQVLLWGNPSDESHDGQRGTCMTGAGEGGTSCPVERSNTAFLAMPSACSGRLVFSSATDSWEAPTASIGRTYEAVTLHGDPVGVEGCSGLDFEPSIYSRATNDQGESPSGLDFELHQPQHLQFDERTTANLKDATVTLPTGLVLNPSAATGRTSCSSVQLGVTSPVGAVPVLYREEPAQCPNASKLGSVEVITPLLDHPLKGSVFLAKPFDNPFGTLLGIYLVVEDERSGVIAKLAGKVNPDPATGELTTTFEESPELPIEDVTLHLFPGPRAALTTPLTCGTKTTTSTLIPWSTPEGANAHPTDSFQTTRSCAGSEAAAGKDFSFSAGTVSPLSGSYSPFVLRIARGDGTQHITGVESTLPEGLLGKLAGIAYCPESGIAQARGREEPEMGRLEQQVASCPKSSEVGTVAVTAGSGPNPVAVSGHAYLAGPYKGAPLSLVVIVPAVAGPFDLGTVVDRVALNVGEYDARIHAVADPLPTIRDGIPLDVRSIELNFDRSGFTLNPTSCEAMAIEATALTQAGQSVALANHFQVGDCSRLAFKPSLKLSLKGSTRRTGHPALKAVVTYPKHGEYANITRAQVSLPHSEFLDQGNIGKACTKSILAAHACPAKSIYGKVKAWTPLLERPLEGPVYLVGGYGYKLPALVAELNGQIRVLLVGKVDTGKRHGIRNTFEAVPDAPVSRFVLEMKGGKRYGLLENSENICRKTQKAGVAFKAQNGRAKRFSVKIVNSCPVKRARGKKSAHHHKGT